MPCLVTKWGGSLYLKFGAVHHTSNSFVFLIPEGLWLICPHLLSSPSGQAMYGSNLQERKLIHVFRMVVSNSIVFNARWEVGEELVFPPFLNGQHSFRGGILHCPFSQTQDGASFMQLSLNPAWRMKMRLRFPDGASSGAISSLHACLSCDPHCTKFHWGKRSDSHGQDMISPGTCCCELCTGNQWSTWASRKSQRTMCHYVAVRTEVKKFWDNW